MSKRDSMVAASAGAGSVNAATIAAPAARLDHPGLDFLPLASGELFCIVPEGHELGGRKQVSAAEIMRYPLIGIDPNDPYGRIMAEIFARRTWPMTSPSGRGSAPPSARWSRPASASP